MCSAIASASAQFYLFVCVKHVRILNYWYVKRASEWMCGRVNERASKTAKPKVLSFHDNLILLHYCLHSLLFVFVHNVYFSMCVVCTHSFSPPFHLDVRYDHRSWVYSIWVYPNIFCQWFAKWFSPNQQFIETALDCILLSYAWQFLFFSFLFLLVGNKMWWLFVLWCGYCFCRSIWCCRCCCCCRIGSAITRDRYQNVHNAHTQLKRLLKMIWECYANVHTSRWHTYIA